MKHGSGAGEFLNFSVHVANFALLVLASVVFVILSGVSFIGYVTGANKRSGILITDRMMDNRRRIQPHLPPDGGR